MKNKILNQVKDSIAAALLGKTPEQLAVEQREAAVKSAVDRFFESNQDWKPSTQPGKAGLTSLKLTAVHAAASAKPAPCSASVTNTKQKTARIKKSLGAGAGGFQAHEIDPEMLLLAREKCRDLVAADPERYSHIIESAPLRA
ncbi:hypothetical protein [Klebsiella variicola]|uniref:hypothetical protein n=1 Tax=Klebsiella variicola TaxID=244366 RepID=UPI002B05866C|nr:hypothetical protein [Klebsiella variicola]